MKVTPKKVHTSESTIINCCPHNVNIIKGAIYDPSTKKYRGGINAASFPPSGKIASAVSSVSALPALNITGISIPSCKREFYSVTPLPATNDYYIVSSLYAEACKHLGIDCTHLLTPYGQVYNEFGKVIGCVGLIQYQET